MPIYLGSTKEKTLYYGGTKIKTAYYGSTLVYTSGPSILLLGKYTVSGVTLSWYMLHEISANSYLFSSTSAGNPLAQDIVSINGTLGVSGSKVNLSNSRVTNFAKTIYVNNIPIHAYIYTNANSQNFVVYVLDGSVAGNKCLYNQMMLDRYNGSNLEYFQKPARLIDQNSFVVNRKNHDQGQQATATRGTVLNFTWTRTGLTKIT